MSDADETQPSRRRVSLPPWAKKVDKEVSAGDPVVTSARRKPPRETITERIQRKPWEVLAGYGIAVLAALAGATIAKLESCEARERATTAEVQAKVNQVGQAKAEAVLDETYEDLAAVIKALNTLSADQKKRIAELEDVVKAGLGNTAAGRRFKPAEDSAEVTVALEELQEPLPASPAAAAAKEKP